MRWRSIQAGDLVLTLDNYYALVVDRLGSVATVMNSNGLETREWVGLLRPLSLKVGDDTGSTASFIEVLRTRNGFDHEGNPLRGLCPSEAPV